MNSLVPAKFVVGDCYAHADIYRALGVGNAGGIRPSVDSHGRLSRLVIFTSAATAKISGENPYADRLEGDVLVYTAAGREGAQELARVNARILDQPALQFPIYAFRNIASRRDKSAGSKRWEFLGLFAYQRHYKETQVDARGAPRLAWVFELHRLPVGKLVPVEHERALHLDSLRAAQEAEPLDTSPAIPSLAPPTSLPADQVEEARHRLLALSPESFEHVVKRAVERAGFAEVRVTRYSQDGGVDVEAVIGANLWPLQGTLLQAQAKRWIHTVGRREVAELRGSLKRFARGAIVTTSHYSKAAVAEASDVSKSPIVLVDGIQFAGLTQSLGVDF